MKPNKHKTATESQSGRGFVSYGLRPYVSPWTNAKNVFLDSQRPTPVVQPGQPLRRAPPRCKGCGEIVHKINKFQTS